MTNFYPNLQIPVLPGPRSQSLRREGKKEVYTQRRSLHLKKKIYMGYTSNEEDIYLHLKFNFNNKTINKYLGDDSHGSMTQDLREIIRRLCCIL